MSPPRFSLGLLLLMKDDMNASLPLSSAFRHFRRALITVSFMVSLAFGFAGPGCFDPQIKSGGFRCAGDKCPSGFVCSAGVCVTPGLPGSGGKGGAAATGGRSGTGGATCANAIQPLCTGQSGSSCDPVCQTGCPCGQKCGLSGAALACAAPAGTKAEAEICHPSKDECAPGFACLKEVCGSDLGRCYRFCRTNDDCASTTACTTSGATASTQKVCSLEDQPCDPYAQTGCPDAALKCYFSGLSQTKCDCPGLPSGEKQVGEVCANYNDCAIGLVCLSLGNAESKCFRLCKSTAECASCTTLGSGSYCAQ